MQAAPIVGLSAAVRFEPEGDGSVVIDLVAGPVATTPMAGAIVRRQCTRSLYDGRPVPMSDLQSIALAGSDEGVEIILVTDRPAIDAVAALIVEGNTSQMTNPAYMDELKHWLRYSYDDALSTRDGLFAGASGNPVLPAPIGRALFGMVVSTASENEKYVAQIESSPGLAIFASAQDDKAHWVAAGRAYQRFALQATSLGIKHAFLNQAVEEPDTRRRLAEHLGLDQRRPDLIVRFGYAEDMPFSLRRSVDEVLA